MNIPLNEIFKNLEGTWLLEREIYNILKEETDYAKGIASFTMKERVKMKLYYEENGHLHLSNSGKRLKFQRKYIYKYESEGISIYLDDGVTKGKLFQKLQNTDDSCAFIGTEHICKTDKHNGRYFFENSTLFKTEYKIKGENIDFKIETTYTKVNETTHIHNNSFPFGM